MFNTINKTLGGTITGTSVILDANHEKVYTVTFTRADNRDMTIVVDKELYDRCTQGSLAIFDIDIVMEKGGDVNNYDKKLTRAKGAAFVGADLDAHTYKKKMEDDLTYLRRYAVPLPSKKKSRAMARKERLWSLLFPVLLFGGGIIIIASVPLLIKYQISKGKKYSNYMVTTGEVIEQSSRASMSNSDKYDIDFKIQYEVDGIKYTIRQNFTEHNVSSIFSTQKVIYNIDNPSEGYYAEYNNIAKAYLPGIQANGYMIYIIVFLMGVVVLAVGIFNIKSTRSTNNSQ